MTVCGQAGCLLNSRFASILCMLLKRSFRLILLFPIWPYGKVVFFCFGQKEPYITLHFSLFMSWQRCPLALTCWAAEAVSHSWCCSMHSSSLLLVCIPRTFRKEGCGLCGLSWQECCRLGSPPWLWGAKYTGVCLFDGLCVVCLFSYHVAKLKVQAGHLRSCIRNYGCRVC